MIISPQQKIESPSGTAVTSKSVRKFPMIPPVKFVQEKQPENIRFLNG
jgi:hypothetical protein